MKKSRGTMEFELDGSLKEWAKDKPLSILQLDPADRAVLKIADIKPSLSGRVQALAARHVCRCETERRSRAGEPESCDCCNLPSQKGTQR
ncbi:hypothetical protein PV325_005636 [Microctonus aethiopoides]|nr:hypothetical protein PV325_005636 [Microctonus aethiopoides]